MENFVVSARKYRPAVFAHVLGQEPITTTLKNAIKANHLAQAFLFCGPKGVGKTTCARILAKAINCQNLTLTTEPCNTCHSCTSFNQQRAFNIYELDAASNNSVEDIRSLVEQVRYPPQSGPYKVYIIDEVHMLSQAAFNAFLKTLEEPPRYAIFILATTEKHKVLPTILSRCQIFDFQRIQPQAIVDQLKTIAAQENIPYEEEALHLISQKADGALRDALTMFDLIVTFGSGKLTYQAALENLHVLDYTYYFKLTDYLLAGKLTDTLLLYDKILRTGFDNLYFLHGLSEHMRNLLVCQDSATLNLLEVPPSIQHQYHRQAQKATHHFLLSALQLINQYDIHYKNSHHKRLHIELCLIELVQRSGNNATQAEPTHPSTQPIAPHTALPTNEANSSTATLLPSLKNPNETQEANSTGVNKTTYATTLPANPMQGADQLQTTIKIPRLAQLQTSLNNSANNQASVNAAIPSKALNQTLLLEAWETYAAKLQEEGKLAAYRLLNQKIELHDNTIVISFTNAIQEDMLRNIRESLLTYLRTTLNYHALEVKGILVQEPKTRKPYTAQEKFNFLAQKNPSLTQLKNRLNLNILD